MYLSTRLGCCQRNTETHQRDFDSGGESTTRRPSGESQTAHSNGSTVLGEGQHHAHCGRAGLIDDKRIVWRLSGKGLAQARLKN